MRLRWLSSIIVASVACGGGPDPIESPRLEFRQASFDFGTTQVAASSFGEVRLRFAKANELTFFNLVVNGGWAVRNVPIMPRENESELTFFVGLGVNDGTEVSHLDYAFSLTTEAISASPLVEREQLSLTRSQRASGTAPMEGTQIVHYFGIQELRVTPRLPPPEPIGSSTKVTVGDKARHEGFPNQEQAKSECGPTEVSNSVQFLNARNSLGLRSDQTDVAAMKTAVGFHESDVEARRGIPHGVDIVAVKDSYMKSAGIPISTRRIYGSEDDFWDSVLDAVKQGEDVELHVAGHMTAVVGVTRTSDGSYTVEIADDLKQGAEGGTTILPLQAYQTGTGWGLRGAVHLGSGEEGWIDTTVQEAIVERAQVTPFASDGGVDAGEADAGTACGPETCEGCCGYEGCESGYNDDACGVGGMPCDVCDADESCTYDVDDRSYACECDPIGEWQMSYAAHIGGDSGTAAMTVSAGSDFVSEPGGGGGWYPYGAAYVFAFTDNIMRLTMEFGTSCSSMTGAFVCGAGPFCGQTNTGTASMERVVP